MQEFSCESKPLFAAKINKNATKNILFVVDSVVICLFAAVFLSHLNSIFKLSDNMENIWERFLASIQQHNC